MEQYVPEERIFTSDITSRWTEDTLLTTWLKAASQPSSIIWWNGTYRKQDLVFLSYVYPLQFTRGEQPWARFYDKVGLTGTGWETTERKEADDPLAYVVRQVLQRNSLQGELQRPRSRHSKEAQPERNMVVTQLHSSRHRRTLEPAEMEMGVRCL
jgi:hypothetical protein